MNFGMAILALILFSSCSPKSTNPKLLHRDFVQRAMGLKFKMIYVESGIAKDYVPYLACLNPSENVIRDCRKPRKIYMKNGYFLMETEVTQQLFEKVMGFNPSCNKSNALLPVTNVTTEEAIKFTEELSKICKRRYRLPLEEEIMYTILKQNPVRLKKNPNSKGIYSIVDSLKNRIVYPVNSDKIAYDYRLFKGLKSNVYEFCLGDTSDIGYDPETNHPYVILDRYEEIELHCYYAFWFDKLNPISPFYRDCTTGFRIVCEIK